jgi:hypothetical protein
MRSMRRARAAHRRAIQLERASEGANLCASTAMTVTDESHHVFADRVLTFLDNHRGRDDAATLQGVTNLFHEVLERQRKRGGDFELTLALGRLAMKIKNDRELSEKYPELGNRDLGSLWADAINEAESWLIQPSD